MKPSLYLIPLPISDNSPHTVLPAEVFRILQHINHFIVENQKTAIRFFRRAGIDRNPDDLFFYILDEHTPVNEIKGFLQPLKEGNDVGLMSEAGLPALADPGTEFISLAHLSGFRVIPLAGPSSVTLALIASGLNGQNFAFNGYLPVKKEDRVIAIKKLEEKVYRDKQTQIFMETPYRNMVLLKDLLSFCRAGTKLCIAADLTGKNEFILTLSIKEWKDRLPDIHKKPTIFIIGSP